MPKTRHDFALRRQIERFSVAVTRWSGSSVAFVLALLTILIWLISGPFFKFSDTWQLVINTSTTIVTFLMVFLIQRSQNKESLALQLKLNELVAAMQGASNRLVDVEDLSEDDLVALRAYYRRLASLAKEQVDICESHSIDEAHVRHADKSGPRETAD